MIKECTAPTAFGVTLLSGPISETDVYTAPVKFGPGFVAFGALDQHDQAHAHVRCHIDEPPVDDFGPSSVDETGSVVLEGTDATPWAHEIIFWAVSVPAKTVLFSGIGRFPFDVRVRRHQETRVWLIEMWSAPHLADAGTDDGRPDRPNSTFDSEPWKS
ncbi:hypothetical protein GCM10027418_01860 [Mariniluteicoccus endophyticus]